MFYNNNCFCDRCGYNPCKCCLAGPQGPVGPKGGMTITAFDASNAVGYTQGQLVSSNNTIYVVNKMLPSGVPGTSTDYTAILGPAGRMTSVIYDPAQASQYVAGQLVLYNGVLYSVDRNNPIGTPGTAGSNYTALTSDVRNARDLGGSIVPTFTPALAPELLKGELVFYNGQLYLVNKNAPMRTPGSSADFISLSTGGSGPIGPTGPTGTFPQQTFVSVGSASLDATYNKGDLINWNFANVGPNATINADNKTVSVSGAPNYLVSIDASDNLLSSNDYAHLRLVVNGRPVGAPIKLNQSSGGSITWIVPRINPTDNYALMYEAGTGTLVERNGSSLQMTILGINSPSTKLIVNGTGVNPPNPV